MTTHEQIIKNIKGLNHKQAAFFSWLCAVRALPFLGGKGHFNYWNREAKIEGKTISYKQIHLKSIFDALDMVASRIAYDISYDKYQDADTALIVSANSAFHIAAHASNAAHDAAEDNAANAVAEAVSEAAFAVSNAYAFDIAVTADASYNTVNNTESSEKAYIHANIASSEYNINLQELLLCDINRIKNKTYDEFDCDISIYGEIWNSFQNALKDVGCEYWGNLYVKIFMNRFLQREDTLIQRTLGIPNEIRKQGANSIGRHLEKLDSETGKSLNEARIIVLGGKGSGKTSLARRLVNLDAPMPRVDESTKGVKATSWKIIGNDSSYINTHIWDFAGHVITHAAHRCFLSERCLYILVHRGRSEQKSLNYWLDHIKNYGGNAPTWIVVNKFDNHLPVISKNMLQSKYPFIQGFAFFSIDTEISALSEFRQNIKTFIQNNPLWNNQKIPQSYYEVKSALESRFHKGAEHITKMSFNKIASKLGIEVEKQDELLLSLNELGICHWNADVMEYDALVLNPNWITNGVYKVINWAYNNSKHIVDLENDCKDIFMDEAVRYPEDKYEFIFNLMKKYELAYSKDNKKFAIPHLSEDQPARLPEFPINESLMIKYVSEQDLPPHTVCRLIVRHYEEIRADDEVWKYGVVLKYDSDTIATAIEDDKNIIVTVRGSKRSEYITKLRASMNEILVSYKSDKPELQYRVIENTPREIPQDDSFLAFLTSEEIATHVQMEQNYLNAKSKTLITVEQLNITIQNYKIDNLEETYMRDVFNGTVKQVVSPSDGGVVFNPSQINGIDLNQLNELIESLADTFPTNASDEDREAFNDCIETIKDPDAKRSFIKSAIAALKGIKGSAEFSESIANLVQFFSSL